MRARVEGVDGHLEMAFTEPLILVSRKGEPSYPSRKLSPGLQAQDADRGIMPCSSFSPFLFTHPMVVTFSCALEVVKLVFVAAAYEGVVVYANQHHCWDLLSSPKFYYIGIMDLTR